MLAQSEHPNKSAKKCWAVGWGTWVACTVVPLRQATCRLNLRKKLRRLRKFQSEIFRNEIFLAPSKPDPRKNALLVGELPRAPLLWVSLNQGGAMIFFQIDIRKKASTRRQEPRAYTNTCNQGSQLLVLFRRIFRRLQKIY